MLLDINLGCKNEVGNLVKKWEMSSLKINAKILQMEFKLNDSDRKQLGNSILNF